MPFRNSVISAVIATALTGQRIVIDALTGLGSVIEFYSGDAAETEPARIRSDDLTASGPGLLLQGHELSNQPAGSLFLGADPLASKARVNLYGTEVQCIADEDFVVFMNPLTGDAVEFTNVRRMLWNNVDQLTRVTSWTPATTSSGGAVNMGASPVRQGDYLISGRNVRGCGYVAWGAGAAGTGAPGSVIFLELPTLPDASYFNRCIGSAVLFFAGGWYEASIFSVATADGARARLVANNVLQPDTIIGAGNVVSWQFDYLSA